MQCIWRWIRSIVYFCFCGIRSTNVHHSGGVVAPIKFYQDDSHKDMITIDLKYQVTMSTSDLLSVVYTGYSNIKGSTHPNNVIYAITIDLKNTTKLKFSDFTTIDTKLAQRIKQSTSVTN